MAIHRLGKRGMEKEQIAMLILAALFFVIILVVIGRFIFVSQLSAEENLCSLSVKKSATDGKPSFNCDATYSTIKRSDFSTKLSSEELDDEVKRKIADMMWLCWKKTAKSGVVEGIANPYTDTFERKCSSDKQMHTGPTNREFYLICDIVSFKDIPDFNGLLHWTAINKPEQATQSYYDYLHNKKPTEEDIDGLMKLSDIYDTDKRYVVAWNHTRLMECMGTTTTAFDSVVFVPYDELIAPDKGTGDLHILMN